MAHRHFFRVPDPKALAELDAAPWLWQCEWERSYGDSGIISEETSPQFETEAECREYMRSVRKRPDFREWVNGPLKAKPPHLCDRVRRMAISHAEAAGILGLDAIAPPVVD